MWVNSSSPYFRQPFLQFLRESFGFVPMLKPQHGVICVPDDNDIAFGLLLPPLLHPQIESMVQLEIGKDRRYHRPLRSPFLRLAPLALLHHARRQPFSDQTDDSPVSNPPSGRCLPSVLGIQTLRDGYGGL